MQCTNRSLLGALVVLVYAVSVEAQSRQVSVIKDVWGTDPKVWMEASPSRYLRADLPPVLLIYTDGDEEWRRKQNDDMAAALRSAGHKASFCRWTFAKHPNGLGKVGLTSLATRTAPEFERMVFGEE